MIQNSTDADRLERLDGFGSENVAPKRELLGCLGPEMDENAIKTHHLELSAARGPK